MDFTKSSNPVLGENVFKQSFVCDSTMTMKGVTRKTLIFLIIVLAIGSLGWKMTIHGTVNTTLIMGSAVAAFVFALITSFAKKIAAITGSLYAACEGFFLGSISSLFEKQYKGIVFQAVMLTVLTLGIMLFLYRAGILKATGKLVKGVVAATLAIGAFYLINFIAGFFTDAIPNFFAANPLLSIGLSVVIVVIAALNLILDFNFIETSVEQGSPKYMEWYAAFGLMVTLVWLYVEFLRLLSKIRD